MKKILLVGCGYWGKNWYKTIINSKHKLVGVVDPSPAINPVDDNIPHYKSITEVDYKDITHAIVATPVKDHFDSFTFLLNQGINSENILVEKPFGLSYKQASSMEAAYPGFIFLHDPSYQWIKKNLPKLGNILSFDSIRASMGPRIRTDVSIVEDYLIHDLYMFGDLFGYDEGFHCTSLRRNHFAKPIQTSEITLNFKKNFIEVNMFSS